MPQLQAAIYRYFMRFVTSHTGVTRLGKAKLDKKEMHSVTSTHPTLRRSNGTGQTNSRNKYTKHQQQCPPLFFSSSILPLKL